MWDSIFVLIAHMPSIHYDKNLSARKCAGENPKVAGRLFCSQLVLSVVNAKIVANECDFTSVRLRSFGNVAKIDLVS